MIHLFVRLKKEEEKIFNETPRDSGLTQYKKVKGFQILRQK